MIELAESGKRVPRSVPENLQYRRTILELARGNPRYQKALIEACRADALFWINTFVMQYNPNLDAGLEVGPFVTWEFQDKGIRDIERHIREKEDVVIEKSREMGWSWLVLLLFTHQWLFHRWRKFLCLSRNKEAVDDTADPDSLFWKIDFVLRYLPDWMMPRGWNPKRHRLEMRFQNPQTGSTITGAASTGSAGIGGRATAILLDEFSRFGSGKKAADTEVLRGTADVSKCRIFVSTHTGEGTEFAALCQRPDMPRIVTHWSSHPVKRRGMYQVDPKEPGGYVVLDKTYDFGPDFKPVLDGSPTGGPFPGLRSPWYDAECRRRKDPRAIAMDLDINVQGTVSQFFNPLIIRRLQRETACPPLWEGDVFYDRSRGVVLRFQERPGGPLKLWMRPDLYQQLPRAPYAAGGDVAAGTGASPSVLSFFDCRRKTKVGVYKDAHIDPVELCALAASLMRAFQDESGNPALFAWEMAGPGIKFGLDLVRQYGMTTNVYYREDEFDGKFQRSERPGWYPQPKTKLLLFQHYRAALEAGDFVNPSHEGLEELLSFQYDARGQSIFHPKEKLARDPSAAGVNHGDEGIADALAWLMARHRGYAEPKEEERKDHAYGTVGWILEQHDRQVKRQDRGWGRAAYRRR